MPDQESDGRAAQAAVGIEEHDRTRGLRSGDCGGGGRLTEGWVWRGLGHAGNLAPVVADFKRWRSAARS